MEKETKKAAINLGAGLATFAGGLALSKGVEIESLQTAGEFMKFGGGFFAFIGGVQLVGLGLGEWLNRSNEKEYNEILARLPKIKDEFRPGFIRDGINDWTLEMNNRAKSQLINTYVALLKGRGLISVFSMLDLDCGTMARRLPLPLDSGLGSEYRERAKESIRFACELLDMALPIDVEADPEGPNNWFEFVVNRSRELKMSGGTGVEM